MMKSIGIVAEYNPFHQGHKYLIEEAKSLTGAEVCVSVMSGNFVQRGAPAISNKWERAKDAVEHGVNLVVELPTVFACNSAEYFAKGSVSVLEGFGCIDALAFGSELGDVEQLQKCANFLISHDKEIHNKIQCLTKEGYSYPKARQSAMEEINGFSELSLLRQPNNILAVEYLKQIKTMKPITVKRIGQSHHDSASKIRMDLFTKEPETFINRQKVYFDLIRAKVLQTDKDKLEETMAAGQGLGNKLKEEIRYANSIEELIERVKSKSVTYTRINRLCSQILLGINDQAFENAACYIRVLAFDHQGAKFLKELKKSKKASLPILTNINKEVIDFPEIENTLHMDILASDLYNIICGEDLYENSDYVAIPYVKK